jgi:geranylgeranyl pyrophosphate synthase
MNKERKDKTQADIDLVLSLIEKHGAVPYARERALGLMEEALRVLRGVKWPGDQEAASLLESFARFAVEREW